MNKNENEGMKCQSGVGCPYCSSKKIKQVDYEYPIFECLECGKRYFSD